MVELNTMTPAAGRDPVAIGKVTLAELNPGAMTSLSAFGDPSAMAAALKKAHGMAWPAPGQSTEAGEVRCIWFGLREVLLMGATADAALEGAGAVVDQSDAWVAVELSGADATDVLARLVPLDLRDSAFPVGATARTQVMHMNASVTKLGAERFMILVFRSMVETLYHDLEQAMAAFASRR